MTKFCFPLYIIVFVLSLSLNSCDPPQQEVKEETPVNYVVLLDLSDRLLNEEQSDRDIAQLKAVLDAFSKQVQQRLFILSNDRFQVRILPQKGSTLKAEQYEGRLSVNMANVQMAEKADFIEQFVEDFPKQVKDLYQEALLGNKSTDFAGVDIWKYFKYHLQSDLPAGYHHKVIVITDGYFDFEDNSHVMQAGQRFTHSGFLSDTKLSTIHWREYAEKLDVGYIPVHIEGRPDVMVSGIRPKNDRLPEEEKLRYFWSKWLRESCGSEAMFISDASPEKMSEQLHDFLLLK